MTDSSVFIGIDTSNYTTSIAVCDNEGNILLNLKKLLDVKEGERGLRQSDAVFAHTKNFSQLADELAKAIQGRSVAAVGVSVTPRDAEGSYMPCFLVGKSVASMISATSEVPLYCFSHQSGHIMAALHSSGVNDMIMRAGFIAFHVSGGTTEALLVKPKANGFDVQLIAETADISAGQAIDRVGVMMGMKFPCGKEIEHQACEFTGVIPKYKISVKNGKCNFSGLENISQKLYKETGDKSYVSACVLDFVANTLCKITEDIRNEYGDLPILYAGGVMSNKLLQARLSAYGDTYFATPEFSTDNAAGIALLARKAHN